MKGIFVYEHLSGGGATAGRTAELAVANPEKTQSDELLDSLLGTGESMRDAIVSDLLRLGNYRVTVATCAAASKVPHGAAPVQARARESAFEFVAREADAHDLVWVVAPETGGVLAQVQQCVDPARWLGCDAAAIALTTGKRATLQRLAAAGVATPLAFEHAPEVRRWVVKPDDGAGAVNTRLHATLEAALEDWSRCSRAGSPMTVEPWIEGEALSLSLLCGATRCELLSVNRQRLAIDGAGVLAFQGVDVNAWPATAALLGVARRVAGALPGLRGFVGIDLVWHAQRGPVVIEINPRVTCAYVGLSQALGRNLAAEVIAACRGEEAR